MSIGRRAERHDVRGSTVGSQGLLVAALVSLWGCGGGKTDDLSVSGPALALSIGSNAVGTTAVAPVTFSFEWSHDVGQSFTADDVEVSGGTPSDWRQIDGSRYTLVVTPHASDAGTITVAVPAGRASDLTGHTNALATQMSQAYDTRSLAGWRLVWSDEFSVNGLPDASKWDYDTYRNSIGWFNNELQYYARDRTQNAQVSNGRLIITARKERLTAAADYGNQAYTSARLVTRGKASWTYGFVEVRAKTPCSAGTWPAIWMLGSGGRWPEDGEIDLMEQNGWNKTAVSGTVHTRAYNYFNGSLGVGQGATTRLDDACNAFHNYQLTWTPERIQIGVDGRVYKVFDNPGNGDRTRWPFDQAQYLILNIAMGGDLGGAVPAQFTADQMEVDYVRVYQR